MSANFVFPPPPPPPPQNQSTFTPPQQFNRSGPGFRGRGQRGHGYANSGGRGRGSNFQPLGQRGGHAGPTQPFNNPPDRNYQNALRPFHQPRGNNNLRGTKRDHGAAFGRGRGQAYNYSSTAPPPVPDFNALDRPTPAPNPQEKEKAQKKKPRVQNVLGLTPGGEDHESSEEEIDEEARYAESIKKDGSVMKPLSVFYRGKVTSLNTPEELAAWISERRARFPTKERAEKAKQEREEFLAKREKERQERMQNRGGKQGGDRGGRAGKKSARQEPDAVMAELERTRAKLRELEEQIQASKLQEVESKSLPGKDDEVDEGEVTPSSSDTESDSEITSSSDDDSDSASSSDTDDSDSDAPIEEANQKDTEPLPIAAPPNPQLENKAPRERPLCQDFAKRGICKRGRMCKFRHEGKTFRQRQKGQQSGGRPGQRMSLYQRLMARQEEEDQIDREAERKRIAALNEKEEMMGERV